jgi:hypothetical protein
MLHLIHNICGLKVEKICSPQKPTTIIQDNYVVCPTTRNILIQVEPEAIRKAEDQIINVAGHYDYILTFNEKVLQSCSNSYKYLFGMCRIIPEDYLNIDIDRKKFVITSVTNDKLMTVGHHFRHAIYFNQEKIHTIPTEFFISADSKDLPSIKNNPRLRVCPYKIDMFKDAQFSLVIENSRQTHYFTEKLCDCLITKTIPVYYGCPNISEYFDTTGWIILEDESLDNFLTKLQMLDKDYYLKYMDTIEKNYTTVKQYIDIHENINRTLKTIQDY